MAAWGAGAVGMALQAGLMGLWLLLAVAVLRPRASWRAGLTLLGLAQFLVPALFTLPVAAPVLAVPVGGAPGLPTLDALAVVAAAQLAGAAVCLIFLGRSALALRRVVRTARRVTAGPVHDALRRVASAQGTATPRLYLTTAAGPGAIGIARPAVLLPTDLVRRLDPEALRMVLAHEVAHCARRDPLTALIRRLAVALWWFHPVAWILARKHRTAVEDACDDTAVLDAPPAAYCDALLQCARAAYSAPPMAATLWRNDRDLHPMAHRVRRLLQGRPTGRPALGGAAARWGLAAVVAAGLLAAPVQFVAFQTGPGTGSHDGVVIRHVIRAEPVVRHVIGP